MIENKKQLIENGITQVDREARYLVVESLDHALQEIDPYKLIKSQVSYDGKILRIRNSAFDLSKIDRVFIIGGGKASGAQIQAFEELLNDKISDGIINILEGSAGECKTSIVKLNEASHPIPSKKGIEGVEKMLRLVDEAGKNDLILCLISGGGSAMMPLPVDGVTLEEKQEITKKLLISGADIHELNAVRKHLSEFKGGNLAKRAHPAKLISLILSDVVGDPLDVIASGPTAPDNSNYGDAITILKKYDLWKNISVSIKKIFMDGIKGKISETPKSNDMIFQNVNNFIIGNNQIACNAAIEKLETMDVDSLYLTSCLEGEAKQAGLFYSALAHSKYSARKHLLRPFAMIIGGETTVTVKGNGVGGRNQEAILSTLIKIDELEGVSIASLGTDGIDGPTDAAGAIIDGKSNIRSKEMNLSSSEYLKNNDSYNFLKRINELIFTGPTGSNVNDLAIIIIMPKKFLI